MQKFFLTLIATLALWGQPALAAPADKALVFAEKITSEIQLIVTAKTPDSYKEKELTKIFKKNVDIPWIAKFSMGRYWRQATEEQKKRYLKAYEDYLIRTYIPKFKLYDGQSFALVRSQKDSDDEFTVFSIVDGKDGQKIDINYKLRQIKKTFKLYDIVAEGVSLLTAQRAEFSSVLSRKGIDYLLEILEKQS